MGVLDQLFERRFIESRDGSLSLTNYRQWVELGLAGESASGVIVNADTAMRMSAVYACVRIVSETIASLPLLTYERLDRGKKRAPDHPLYNLLKERPNPWMTSFEYRETVQAHLSLRGNAYSHMEFDGRGNIIELFPLHPDRIRWKKRDGVRVYKYQLPTGRETTIDGFHIWHLRGLSSDGEEGVSPIGMMKQAVGLGLAAEEFGARFFGNDARPGGILEHPMKLSDDAFDRLKDDWETKYGGLSKSHKMAILEEGMKYHEIGVNPDEAQFLETRKFQVQEIARMFRVPPHMLADLDRATFSNIEQQSIEFVMHTIRPWLVRWEQSIKQNLMLPRDRERYFPEFLIDALLRGDSQARATFYGSAIQWGWLTRNDVRELENRNPLPELDEPLIPLNMIPADSASNSIRSKTSQGARVDLLPQKTREMREERSAIARQRIQRVHRRLFQDVFARIFRREINDVGAAAQKFLTTRNELEFVEWLEGFYRDHQQFIVKQGGPALRALAEAIAYEAGEEVNFELGSESVGNFVLSYLKNMADVLAADSRGRILAALEEDDALDAIEREFDLWRTERPSAKARDETVQLGNATARMVYVAAGFLVLKWRAIGDSCPYCTALDGVTVEIHKSFISEGSAFQPDGADTPLIPSINIGHPPAHGGCDCLIAPGA